MDNYLSTKCGCNPLDAFRESSFCRWMFDGSSMTVALLCSSTQRVANLLYFKPTRFLHRELLNIYTCMGKSLNTANK